MIIGQFGRFTMHVYRIPDRAMEPTLHCARLDPFFIQPESFGCEADTEDRILVPRLHPFWTPRRGDIIVFKTPPKAAVKCGGSGTFVKRLIGLPGETVSERNGDVSINGTPLKEPYIKRDGRGNESGTWQVRRGGYFFLGDNRAHSCDSREFGSVSRNNLVGPVVAFLWPLDRIGLP